MNQSRQGRKQSGNVKPLIAISLAVIATLYFVTGKLSAQEELSPSAVSSADRDAVERVLSREAEQAPAVEQLTVTAQRITVPVLKPELPEIEVAVVAAPPRIERDPG